MCRGKEMNGVPADKMLGPLGHHAPERQVTFKRSPHGFSSLGWEWPVPDGNGEVPWGALAGPDDEETNLFAHK